MRVQLLVLLRACLLLFLLSGCAEDFGPDQHGQKVPAASIEGQWLVINYWADWCPPCRKEIPELNLLAEQLKGQNVRVLGVNYDGLQGDALQAAIQAFAIGFTVLAEDPAARLQLPRSGGLPVTFIVDPHGRLQKQLLGEQTAAGLAAQLAELREQQP
ncbi:TlpA disulfide reductase family protein [Pseudomonas sp. N040]|uniref:TlpA disulfide reductase family protein n=1 Tax=Pseudomonas sp. N040 TaxID=2785325 RepID=UPI0018A3318A|nr:TlpA disulfide reductase family protein [Pseudomonas sp. N040]MBF7729384.1 TlpA family protein disulfide reductase [Pseudomonas sp. N040]MBW7013024.1 TlpA family protein disulfide reductase [Pseudomonas sp. N040]